MSNVVVKDVRPPFARAGARTGEIVEEKFEAYGAAAYVTGPILMFLYPDGVKPEQYTDMLLIVRILDKLCRIANKKDAFGESPFGDITGYGIVGQVNDKGEMPDVVKSVNLQNLILLARTLAAKQGTLKNGDEIEVNLKAPAGLPDPIPAPQPKKKYRKKRKG